MQKRGGRAKIPVLPGVFGIENLIFAKFILYFQDGECNFNKEKEEEMNFIEPDRLYLLLVPCLLIPLFAVLAAVKRKKILVQLLGEKANSPEALHLSKVRRVWRYIFLFLSLVFLVIALGRPYFHARLLPFKNTGRDLLVLCDVSRSMNSTDIAPSRLRHAAFLLRELADRHKEDRFGLIPFAGNAYLSCPLTSDGVTFKEYVDELSTDSVPLGGTNLERALKTALRAFEGSQSGSRGIILLTDGEELQGKMAEVVSELARKKIPVFAVGFGDPAKGSVIPVEPGKSALLRDKEGKIVLTKLNEKGLASLASATGGIYLRTSVTDSGVDTLGRAIAGLDRRKGERVTSRLPVEEFPKFLAASLFFLLLFLLISERGKAKVQLLFLVAALFLGQGSGEVKRSENAYDLYNRARQLQLEKKSGFEELYRKVITLSEAPDALKSRSFHNLGVELHKKCLAESAAGNGELKQGKLQESLNKVNEALQLADGAEELYASCAAGSGKLPSELASNLDLLARERQKLEELRKKIEELLKQQQKAQNQTSQAQQQNRSAPQNRQQHQQQQRSIEQAQKEAQKLQNQAQQMKQSDLAKSAANAAKELQKAADAKKKGADQQSSQHIRKALDELKKNSSGGKSSENKEKHSGKEEKMPPKSDAPKGQGAPRNSGTDDKKMGAEQMLELMGEEEKNLRDALKKQMRMNRPQIEKDW